MLRGLKRLLAVLLCAALCGSLSACDGGGEAYRYTLHFSAIASPEDATSVGSFINALTLSERRMAVCEALLDTESFRERLSAACGGCPTSAQLEKMIDYTSQEDIGIVEVTVTACSRSDAETVGKAISRLAPEYLAELTSSVSFRVVEEHMDSYPLSWRSTQRLYVNSQAGFAGDVELSLSELQSARALADTVKTICKSRSFLEELANTADCSLPFEELSSLISVGSVDETAVLEVRITHSDRALTERLSSAFGPVLDEKIQMIVSGSIVTEVESPRTEAYPAY